MTTDKFVPMTTGDLAKAWPDYAETHDLSDTELAVIASLSANAAEATALWVNEDCWMDPKGKTYREMLDRR